MLYLMKCCILFTILLISSILDVVFETPPSQVIFMARDTIAWREEFEDYFRWGGDWEMKSMTFVGKFANSLFRAEQRIFTNR